MQDTSDSGVSPGRRAVQTLLSASKKRTHFNPSAHDHGMPATTAAGLLAVVCREVFGGNGAVVFGWVFAAHQIGAALAAFGAGYLRDLTGAYTLAWFAAAALCAVAATISLGMRRGRPPIEAPLNAEKEPVPQ